MSLEPDRPGFESQFSWENMGSGTLWTTVCYESNGNFRDDFEGQSKDLS